MRTEDLIARLARNLPPTERGKVSQRLTVAMTYGLGVDAFVLVALFGYDTDMPEQILQPMFWLRLAFPLAMMAAALNLTERLGRPGTPLAFAWLTTSLPFLTMFMVAAIVRYVPGGEHRLQWEIARSSLQKAGTVTLLAIPALLLVLRELKRMMPTRLMLAGAGAGALAGSEGLFVYSIYCSDSPLTFWSLEHILGVVLSTLIGAVVSSKYLRW